MRVAWIVLLGVLVAISTSSAQPAFPLFNDFDDGAQGWALAANTSWQAAGGNPGGYLFTSGGNDLATRASAPSSWYGNWSALDGVGAISLDYRLITLGGSPYDFTQPSIHLSGPGGSAVWPVVGTFISAPSPWTRFEALLAASEWVVASGTWQGLLVDVTDLQINFSTVFNNSPPQDTNGLDNVRVDVVSVDVPEPVGLALLPLAGIVLMNRAAQRKRDRNR